MTLVSTSSLDILEAFRVPYELASPSQDTQIGRVASTSGAELLWIPPAPGAPKAWHMLGPIPIFGAVSAEEAVQRAMRETRRDWRPTDRLVCDGSIAGYVWRADDGSTILPFDPNALVRSLLREEYVVAGAATSVARGVYYRIRPVLPRPMQMALRRRFARLQERSTFPTWPAETALHDLYAYVLRLFEDLLGTPLPWISPWPALYQWSVVLTHDVEMTFGYGYIKTILALEREAGVRSAWYFVPERDYKVDDELVGMLWRDAFEVCVHGLHHDGRDLSPGIFDERLPTMQSYAERWGAVGFRAPATQRDWERVSRLGFEHDSSYSDVARYEPQAGGSCSLHPFFVGDVVELPITLPMDHTLFELLGSRNGNVWFEKAEIIRNRGGMALLLTHPDYMSETARLAEYERFVAFVASDSTAWLALPREVAAWWRRRAASSLELDGAVWRTRGPAAAEACVVMGVTDRYR